MKKKVGKEVLSWIITIAAAVIVALLIREYVVNIAYVPTGSMIPTIEINDKIIVSRISLFFEDIKTDDLVVFKPNESVMNNRTQDKESLLVKRVIAKGGETIEIKAGVVYINGVPKSEPYVFNKSKDDFAPFLVPDGCYFVMGDNRSNSWDARFWDQHYVKRDEIIGKAVYRFGALK